MEFQIRLAAAEDMPQVLNLIKELAKFENEPDAVEVNVDDLKAYGFGKDALFKCFVAEIDATIVGMALFYSRFSTWKGETYHLEDLIVTQSHRQKGIGKALLEALILHAKTHKIKRVEWVVLDWNSNAIEFYKSYGATVFKEWRTVQLDEAHIKNINL
ncbi:GNAT family N-acetyltransferase [Psychroflexus sp. ALD_RP9]|uniref:GNAT family N-acetyltransferase n=1 Tax=Psychroflexus sp. ALD_RP9 TaxID=2777186 RepID=UPI001A8CF0D3|nr:GNAT family N-acetyltransferase [Psychroflexus sp. ALD_RP9]QSS96022.1 GNAT family N-acetyltransferase [Psychroflexus sp. ALD_RP9]